METVGSARHGNESRVPTLQIDSLKVRQLISLAFPRDFHENWWNPLHQSPYCLKWKTTCLVIHPSSCLLLLQRRCHTKVGNASPLYKTAKMQDSWCERSNLLLRCRATWCWKLKKEAHKTRQVQNKVLYPLTTDSCDTFHWYLIMTSLS